METIEFVTPSKHKVYIKPYLTFGESRAIEKLYISQMSIAPGATETGGNIAGSLVYEAEDMTVKFMVQKIVASDGAEFTGNQILEAIANMADEDGRAIYKKIDEITSKKQLAEDTKKN